MADKKVPQEPCVFCGHNPCDCGQPSSRKKRLLAANPEPKEEVSNEPGETHRTSG